MRIVAKIGSYFLIRYFDKCDNIAQRLFMVVGQNASDWSLIWDHCQIILRSGHCAIVKREFVE